jgi:hypothetical protein
VMRLRLTEQMCDSIRVIADFEDRSVQDECRHLIRLGLEQKLETVRTAKVQRNLSAARKRFLQLFGEDA